MPLVQINWYAGRTKEQKAAVAKAFTEDMVRILECKPEAVTIIFRDVSKEDWAKAGCLVCDQPK